MFAPPQEEHQLEEEPNNEIGLVEFHGQQTIGDNIDDGGGDGDGDGDGDGERVVRTSSHRRNFDAATAAVDVDDENNDEDVLVKEPPAPRLLCFRCGVVNFLRCFLFLFSFLFVFSFFFVLICV